MCQSPSRYHAPWWRSASVTKIRCHQDDAVVASTARRGQRCGWPPWCDCQQRRCHRQSPDARVEQVPGWRAGPTRIPAQADLPTDLDPRSAATAAMRPKNTGMRQFTNPPTYRRCTRDEAVTLHADRSDPIERKRRRSDQRRWLRPALSTMMPSGGEAAGMCWARRLSDDLRTQDLFSASARDSAGVVTHRRR